MVSLSNSRARARPEGLVLGGRYKLGPAMGGTPESMVFKAMDKRLGVVRAVRVLRRSEGADWEKALRAFRRGSQLMSGLQHPHVVRLYDAGQAGELNWVVMELVRGNSLAAWLMDRGVLSESVTLCYAAQVLSALGAAHDVGVFHRRVHPRNILVDRSGRALLKDFGLSPLDEVDYRVRSGGAPLPAERRAYLAPELRSGLEPAGASADLYALGCSIFELITGRSPMDLHVTPKLSARWRGLSDPLVDVLRQATALEPAARYPDARAMAAQLLPLLASVTTPPSEGPGGPLTVFSPPSQPATDAAFRALLKHEERAVALSTMPKHAWSAVGPEAESSVPSTPLASPVEPVEEPALASRVATPPGLSVALQAGLLVSISVALAAGLAAWLAS